MADGRLRTYLGQGLLADRPEAPDVPEGTLAIWRDPDTTILTYWNPTTLAWEADPSAFVDAPSDGLIYGRIDGAWQEIIFADGSVEEAPEDGTPYVRQDAAWESLPPPADAGIEEAPEDGTPYSRQDAGWVASPSGGGSGGGGGMVSATWWRIRCLVGQPGHQGDGIGFTGVNWRDSGGVGLIGSGTPFASHTDSSWNLAQAFDGDVSTNGHGWYSSNGDYSANNSPWLAYQFLTPVTPASVEFAPISNFTWSVPRMVAHEFSSDGENWQTLQITENQFGIATVVKNYTMLPRG